MYLYLFYLELYVSPAIYLPLWLYPYHHVSTPEHTDHEPIIHVSAPVHTCFASLEVHSIEVPTCFATCLLSVWVCDGWRGFAVHT